MSRVVLSTAVETDDVRGQCGLRQVPRLTQTHGRHQEGGCAALGPTGGSQSSSWVCVAVLSRCGGGFAPPLPSRGYVEHLERGRLLQLSVSLQTVKQRMQFPGQFVKSPFKSFNKSRLCLLVLVMAQSQHSGLAIHAGG